MKINKVEISAFRAYNSPDNATFDFTIEPNEIANFVSIYAPNGFGKTSFYDAVEWCMTDNIERFSSTKERAKENELYTKDNAQIQLDLPEDKTAISFLKHYSNDINEVVVPDGYVNVFYGDENKKRKIPKTKYQFKKDAENKYFKDVILSQENIDAFLKEESPELRYQKFVEHFGYEKLNSTYNNFVTLIKKNDEAIKELEKELEKVSKTQIKLNFEGDTNLLDDVNTKIEELKKLGESINLVETSFTEIDFGKFTSSLIDRTMSIKSQIILAEERIKTIDFAISGDEENKKGLSEYYTARQNSLEIELKLKALQKQKLLVERRIALNNEISNKKTEIQGHLIELEKLREIIQVFPKYTTNANSKVVSEKDLEAEKLINELLKKEGKTLKQTQTETEIKIKSVQESILLLTGQLTDLPTKSKKIDDINSEFSKQTSDLQKIKKILEGKSEIKKNLETSIKKIDDAILEIPKSIYPSIVESEFIKYNDLIKSLELTDSDIEKLKQELKNINLQIKQQELLNSEIQKFISQGSVIVNTAQSSSCPLCSFEYDSFKTLADKIANNNSLSSSTQVLISKRNIIESSLKSLIEKLTGNKSQFILELEEIKKPLKLSLSETEAVIGSEETNKKSIEEKIKTNESEKGSILLSLNGLSFSELETKYKTEFEKLSSEIKVHQTMINELKNKAIINLEKNEVSNNKLTQLIALIKEFSDNEDLKKVKKYFSENYPDLLISLELLEQKEIELKTKISEWESREKEINIDIENLNHQLVSIDESKLTIEIDSFSRSHTLIAQALKSFEIYLKSEFGIEVAENNKESLNILLEDQKIPLKNSIEKFKSLKDKYLVLDKVKDNIMPYLTLEKTKASIQKINSDLDFKKDILRKELESEKNKLSVFIEKQVESFFYEEQINLLYSKLDPHPVYKKINFKCVFPSDNSSPRLIVIITGENDDNSIVPNLYFSTAQLNILSLSIFLAKALHAKDEKGKVVECIFIDDPIQSMDSINILSTIDLIRSIVVNLKRQIILSTHDENFHNLLKKKLPKDLFKSKFIELETFGKIKKETA